MNNLDEDIEKRLYEEGKSDDYILGYLKGYAQGEYDTKQKLNKELETYKKIAEKMADYINELVPFSNPRALPLMIVDDEYKTPYRTRKNTIEVFEYLARKEVEKDEL